jgi:hypothetical protein
LRHQHFACPSIFLSKNTIGRRRLSTADLLIKAGCFVIKKIMLEISKAADLN